MIKGITFVWQDGHTKYLSGGTIPRGLVHGNKRPVGYKLYFAEHSPLAMMSGVELRELQQWFVLLNTALALPMEIKTDNELTQKP